MEQVIKDGLVIPRHVAIILDGNGRWAKAHGVPRKLGHAEGCKTIEKTIEDCVELGIEYVTVYGFSTENWKRSEEEVSALISLFKIYARKLIGVAVKNNVRVRIIGERSRFDAELRDLIEQLETKTQMNTGLTFVIAINYGSRDEMVRAARKMLDAATKGEVSAETLDEEKFASYLDTAGMPDPDLLIRTSGEQRLSNYLLWQLAYTEFYFTDIYWPDFNKDELMKAIVKYNSRERRFGGRK